MNRLNIIFIIKEATQSVITGYQYSYHYKKVLKKRILDKRKELTDDIPLITKAEDKLQSL